MPATIIDSEDTAVDKIYPLKTKVLPSLTYILVEKEVKETRKTWHIILSSAVEEIQARKGTKGCHNRC